MTIGWFHPYLAEESLNEFNDENESSKRRQQDRALHAVMAPNFVDKRTSPASFHCPPVLLFSGCQLQKQKTQPPHVLTFSS